MNPNVLERPDAEALLNRAERSRLFELAQDRLFDIPDSGDFEAYCTDPSRPEHNVDIDAQPTAQYYYTLGDYVAEHNAEIAKQTGKRTISMIATELLAEVPCVLYADATMHQDHYVEDEEYMPAKDRASNFNRLIREFAAHKSMSELYVDELVTHLVAAMNNAIQNGDMKRWGFDYLRGLAYGAQHEGGFIQVAREAKLPYEAANREQDERGVDARIYSKYGPVDFDVKAGQGQVKAHGALSGPYSVSEDGVITITSGIHQDEFQGKFRVPSHVLRAKAPALIELVNQIGFDIHVARRLGGQALVHYGGR